MMRIYSTFAEADAARGDDMLVSGVYAKVPAGEDPYSQPAYFLVPADAAAADMRRIAFEAREGRQMDAFMRMLLTEAEIVAGK